ncbi:uncharacterized protein LOC124594335 [Schistocerca americana]|uniref:uncharacterized protein LOC124594335 n=1 Tax=Schistocerca americana TaxID=7009 RepID=UPI001F4F7C88|nr:uncharacterized protein LOC124594335 [Schistocerca americana]
MMCIHSKVPVLLFPVYSWLTAACVQVLLFPVYSWLIDVLLFPEEGWARSASSSYWTLTPAWWSRSRCKVVEVAGTRRYSAQAKMVDTGSGSLYIIGTFKRVSPDPDFKLYLTSSVSPSDFNMGYSMTGTLERGCRSSNTFQTTHFAVIRRHDYDMP